MHILTRFHCLLIIAAFSNNAAAMDASMLGGQSPDSLHLAFEHQHTSSPESSPSVNVEEQKGVLTILIAKGTKSSLAFIGGGHRTELSESLRFPDRNVVIPKEIQSTQAGLSWSTQAETGNRYGISASYGRAGTGFWSGDGSAIMNVTGSMEKPLANGNSWLFFLNYSNNRTTLNNIPLPGVAYSIKGKSYRIILGLPFAMIHLRTGLVSLTAAGSPFSASADLGVRVWGPVQVYGNVAWLPKAYQNLVEGSEDRLIFEGKELGSGLRLYLGRQASISAGYVRAFDRRFQLGKSRTKTSSSPVHLGDADGFQAKLSFGF